MHDNDGRKGEQRTPRLSAGESRRIIARVSRRRLHTPALHVGEVALDPAQAHHARVVLRLADGAEVELFDDAGQRARGVLHLDGSQAVVRVEHVEPHDAEAGLEWIVASAVPKGDRADWMIEKLSELGAAAFIPLAAARSVVLPEGRGKRERWMRIATESAKQSRRRGVMRIEALTSLDQAIARVPMLDERLPSPPGPVPPARSASASAPEPALAGPTKRAAGWFLSTAPAALPVRDALRAVITSPFTLFIGPEGGWTDDELAMMAASGLTPVALTGTILRIETAAIAAGAVIAMLGGSLRF